MDAYEFFALDTETNDLDPLRAAIIELAIVKARNPAECFSSLVRLPRGISVPQEAVVIHGISNEMLQEDGVPNLGTVWRLVTQFVTQHTPEGRQPVLVAYNGLHFDFCVLAHNLYRLDNCFDPVMESPEDLLLLDPWKLLNAADFRAKARPANLKQATVFAHFLGRPPATAHRALPDAENLAAAMPHMLTWLCEQDGDRSIEHVLDVAPRITFREFSVVKVEEQKLKQQGVDSLHADFVLRLCSAVQVAVKRYKPPSASGKNKRQKLEEATQTDICYR